MDDPKNRYFISDGISNGKAWATYTRKPNGALSRVRSKDLPIRRTREEAQADLSAWLKKRFPSTGSGQAPSAGLKGQAGLVPGDPGKCQPGLEQVLNHLNRTLGTSFRPDARQAGYIAQRLGEGYTVEEMQSIVDLKVNQWARDGVMRRYLRPSTLFNREKCEAYLQEVKRHGTPGAHPGTSPVNRSASTDWDDEPDSL